MEEPTECQQVQEYPEGGWGWVVCAASFLTSFIVFGIHNSFGVIYSTLVHELNLDKAESAWVGSVAGSLNFLCGPIAGYLCNCYGNHTIAFAGAFLSILGLILTSFVTETSKMYLTYGLLWGIGSGFSYLPSVVVLGQYFHKRFPVASSMASSGSGVGGLLASPFINYLLAKTGWKNSIRILAGCCVFLLLCAVLYRPRKTPQHHNNRNRKQNTNKKFSRICSSKVWKCKPYLVFTFTIALFQLCYPVPYIHLFEFSQKLGISPAKGSWLIGILSISSTIGKVIFGRISQLKRVESSRIHLLQLGIFIMGLATVLCPLATNYTWVLCYAIVYGAFDGCFVCQVSITISDIVGHSHLTEGLGTLFGVVAIPMSFGPPIAGWLYRAFGNYDSAFRVAGGIAILSSLILFIVPYIQKKQKTSRPPSDQLIQEPNPESVTQDLVTQHLSHGVVTYDQRQLKSGAVRTIYLTAGGGNTPFSETVRETVL